MTVQGQVRPSVTPNSAAALKRCRMPDDGNYLEIAITQAAAKVKAIEACAAMTEGDTQALQPIPLCAIGQPMVCCQIPGRRGNTSVLIQRCHDC